MAVWDLLETKIVAGLILAATSGGVAAANARAKKPRLIVQKTNLKLAPRISLQGDLKVSYKGQLYKNLSSYAVCLTNDGKCPVSAGNFHLSLSEYVQVVERFASSYPENVGHSIERGSALPPNKLVFSYGELKAGDRVCFGLLVEAPYHSEPPAFELEHRGDHNVLVREKLWDIEGSKQGSSWFPWLLAAFMLTGQVFAWAESWRLWAAVVALILLVLSAWRLRVWQRMLGRTLAKSIGSNELLGRATAVALAPEKQLAVSSLTGPLQMSGGSSSPSQSNVLSVGNAGATSPRRLVVKKQLEQFAGQYSILMTSSEPSARLAMRNLRSDAYDLSHKMPMEDLVAFFNVGDNESASASARRILAMEIAAGKSDLAAFDLVLDVLDQPRAIGEHRAALRAAVDLVGRLDQKLQVDQLQRLRVAVSRQLDEGAEFPVAQEDQPRWLHSQQLLTATSCVEPAG